MSIVTTVPVLQNRRSAILRPRSTVHGAAFSLLLTPLSLLILGYHPYAEDGGLYLAGVEYLLTPSLFPHMRQFVTAPLHYSAFSPCIAFLALHSGLSFDTVIFASFAVCLWATIFAAWRIAKQCFLSTREQMGATLLVALWLSLPVAGTSLMLIDPYLTARSLSTPLVLLALASALGACEAQRAADTLTFRRRLGITVVWIALAAIFHPLMAGYGASFVLCAFWMESPQPRSRQLRALSLLGAGIALAAAIQLASPVASATIARVALTRSYWFMAEWEWFEILGLVAPLVILFAVIRSPQFSDLRPLARSSILIGITAVLISVCFARSGLTSFAVAHLQPLRVFQLIYFALLLALGGWFARIALHGNWSRWAVAVVVLSTPVMIPAWLVFPHSPHIELPLRHTGKSRTNQWVAAFDWIRQNTPQDAFFALDSNYISDPNEDAQSFRALAERSSLPDYSKDGGETAVNSELSEAWARGVDAQQTLSSESDLSRHRNLDPLGVTWMVLHSVATTSAICPYNNGTVKVCRLSGH